MNKSSKIYIAGHTGLVGSAFLRKLEENGYRNLVYRDYRELDLRRQKDTEDFFNQEKPEYVFLAAAKVGGILANNTYKADFIYENIMIAGNVIHSAFKFGVKKLLNLGSSCIYPKLAPQPLKEEYLLTGLLEPTNEPYAIAKIAAIKLCRYYNEQYGTNFISVMPTNLYGPNDNFNLETAHVLPALIRKFHLAKLLREKKYEEIKKDFKRYKTGCGLDENRNMNSSGIKKLLQKLGLTENRVCLWGTGKPYREFLYVEDMTEACIFLMKNYNFKEIGEFVNIGTGRDLKIRDLADIVGDIVGFKGDIRWDSSKPDGTPRKRLDISRIKKLRWEPKIDLKSGILKTYQAYRTKMNLKREL